MDIIFPLGQSLGTIPLSSMILNKILYVGINIFLVVIIYSFKISSIPLDLLSFNNLIAVCK